jgi:hypothetical protein
MADRNQSKAERRQGSDQPAKAERKAAKLRRRQRRGAAAPPPDAASPASPSSADRIEKRLARLEQAVAAQSELSEQLLEKLDEVLLEARGSAAHANSAPGPALSEDQADEDDGI